MQVVSENVAVNFVEVAVRVSGGLVMSGSRLFWAKLKAAAPRMNYFL